MHIICSHWYINKINISLEFPLEKEKEWIYFTTTKIYLRFLSRSFGILIKKIVSQKFLWSFCSKYIPFVYFEMCLTQKHRCNICQFLVKSYFDSDN